MAKSIEIETFDFLDAIERVGSIYELATRFTSKVSEHGLTNFLITYLPPAKTSFEPAMVHCAWPEAWRDYYFHHGCWKHDPVATRVLQVRSPFQWREVKAEGPAREVMSAASSFNLQEGLTIPFSAAPGAVSDISMAGRHCRFPKKGRRAVELMATYTHMKAVQLRPPQWNVAAARSGPLTARERECLLWVANGKTDWEISTILSISERTARQHVACAAKKLGCVNRVQAVAQALKNGEISN